VDAAPGRLQADVLTPQGFVRGSVTWDSQGRVLAVQGDPVDEAEAGQGCLPLALPGFVDLHVHGAMGCDVMDAGASAARIASGLARHGTTSWLATTMTAPASDITRALNDLAPLCQQRGSGQARLLGVHLEGPYISDQRLGAQPACIASVDLAQLATWQAMAPIRVLTLAPEVPGHVAAIGALNDMGMRVQIGHSNGSYQDGAAALQAGAAGFTHVFNAMSALHHREPGMVGAALAHAQHAEIIPDLLHVHPGAIRVALRAIPGLYCVSDATAATGMPDGEYRLGHQRVHKCLGAVRLADGTLAGSALTLDQALRNLLSLGLGLREASARVSTIAADYLGLSDRGRLAPGAWADLVVLDADHTVQRVLVEGEWI
jgi:N-acetylglucosamine-6-phosphate deacetylase